MQERAQFTLGLGELNDQLKKAVNVEHAAYCDFVASMFRVMYFPMQKLKLVYMSWPYFPQMHLVAMVVARRLGLEVPAC